MRRPLVIALCALATPAFADDDPAPKPTVTAARLDGTIARLAVRYATNVDGPGSNPAIGFTVPTRAVVTAATAVADHHPHRLPLTPANEAETAFEEVMTRDPAGGRGWAIELTGDPRSSSVMLSVASPKRADLELDLDLEVPTCFVHDIRYAELPKEWGEHLVPAVERLRISDDNTLPDGCGGSSDSVWLAFPTRETAELPGDKPRIGIVSGRLPLTADHLARVEIDLAHELAAVPRDLYTALVIDGSRSVTADEAEAQREIVDAYLRAAPQSHVQVIVYARDGRALLPGWMNATNAAPRVDRELRALAVRNGSNVDAGLEAAAAWLGHVQGTRRVIVFSDERVAERLAQPDANALRKLLPAGTLVHAIAIEGGDGGIVRDDDTLFGGLAKLTEGIGVRGHADASGTLDATMLARPITLDKVEMTAPGWTQLAITEDSCTFDSTNPPVLDAGKSCTWWARGSVSAGPATITGFTWNRPWKRVVQLDAGQARMVARRASAIDGFDGDIAAQIDRIAFALNSVWSMYATWGGTGGYGDTESFGTLGGGTSSSACGCDGGIGTIGHGIAGFAPPKLDMKQQLADAVRTCHPGLAHVDIEVETTVQEIVGVNVEITGGGASTREREVALHDCIVNGVWDTWLSLLDPPAHTFTQIAFDP